MNAMHPFCDTLYCPEILNWVTRIFFAEKYVFETISRR